MAATAILWQRSYAVAETTVCYGISSYVMAEATVCNSISSYTRTAAALLRQQYRSYAVAVAAAMLWQSYAMAELCHGSIYAMSAAMLRQQ